MTTALVFDTESTDKKDGEIIEAAWLAIASERDLLGDDSDRIPAGVPVATRFERRYRPTKPMSYGAIAVHGILPCELEGCEPSSSFTLPDAVHYVVGHSIDYDWELAGSPPNVRRICTFAMAKVVWPDAGGYSLSALTYYTDGPTPETRDRLKRAHNALADCELARRLLVRILDTQPQITTWSQLWEFSEECRIPRVCPHKRYEGVPLSELDDGYLRWWSRLPDLDHYTRIGIEREFDRRYPPYRPMRATLGAMAASLTAAPAEDSDIPF